jgi:hypothetical protein
LLVEVFFSWGQAGGNDEDADHNDETGLANDEGLCIQPRLLSLPYACVYPKTLGKPRFFDLSSARLAFDTCPARYFDSAPRFSMVSELVPTDSNLNVSARFPYRIRA